MTFLEIINGRKTTIMAVLALIVTYCLTKGFIDDTLAILLNGILVVLGYSANVANSIARGK